MINSLHSIITRVTIYIRYKDTYFSLYALREIEINIKSFKLIMAASDPVDSNDFEEYFQLKVVENKQKCMEFKIINDICVKKIIQIKWDLLKNI